ncbi:MAG: dephospho-CoA kinase [Melioribacteraceae bacterium]|nr:dephospho-CoA kinase [Melioribacteraceae bacterium]
MNNKLKVAITGGIGSGKTVFSKMIEEAGYNVIKADEVAKNILVEDESVKNKIISFFGIDSYNDEGLNIEYLAEKVFIDSGNVKKINSIVHPVTIKKMMSLLDAENEKTGVAFCESALIFEANREDMFDYVIVVSADEETRIKRVMERDNISEEEILRRMDNQISEEEKKRNSDFTIINNGTLEELKQKSEFIINLLKTLSFKGD